MSKPFERFVIYKLILLNATFGIVGVWAYLQGYVTKLFAFETTGIGYGLCVLTAVAIAGTFHRAMKVSAAFDTVKNGKSVDTSKFLIKAGYISLISTCLMLVGLWANSLGIFISFATVDFTNTDTILASVASMYGGLKIAFANSLIAIALYVAVRVNLHVLNSATRLLMIDAMATRDAR